MLNSAKKFSFFYLLIIFLFAFQNQNYAESFENPPLHPITEKTLEKCIKLNNEAGHFGSEISEHLLNCSFFQDIFLSYLHNAPCLEEYHKGMKLLSQNLSGFYSVCSYTTNVINFYNGSNKSPWPETCDIIFNNTKAWGFLNSFKMDRDRKLTYEERQQYFNQEYANYQRDGIVKPFILDDNNIQEILPNTLYIFVLLPDGTIVASLERPGEREYHVRDDEGVEELFHYPNHTILAGKPDQVVVSAGAFILHQVNDKKLFFISCKSGHFQPYYCSLDHMRTRLSQLGIDENIIIKTPDVDISRVLLKVYKIAQVPVSLLEQDNEELFEVALNKWKKTYCEIDKTLLTKLKDGNFEDIDDQLVLTLKGQRSEGTYMRSAYRCFSIDHDAPDTFKDLVRCFGKLKDAVKRYRTPRFNAEKVQEEAAKMLQLMDQYDRESDYYLFKPASEATFYNFFTQDIQQIQELLACKSLSKEEFHTLKKLSREIGSLFGYLSEYSLNKGRGYFIYRTTAEGFLQINDHMASSDYIYDSNDPTKVLVPKKIDQRLIAYINHLGIAPPSAEIEIDAEDIKKMINNSSGDIYWSSAELYKMIHRFLNDGKGIYYHETLQLMKYLKRGAEYSRNAWVFLDITHDISDECKRLIEVNDLMIKKIEKGDWNYFSENAEALSKLCYHGPMKIKDWVCTDQASFNSVLAEKLADLQLLQEGSVLNQNQIETVRASAQAISDLSNYYRQRGIYNKNKKIPLVFFDILEDRSENLANALEKMQQEDIVELIVTHELWLQANFICSKIKI